jgi:hypothetical protein
MPTLENRPNTALLVIDVQNGVVGDAYERDTVVANVGTVVEKARAAEVPVVWVLYPKGNRTDVNRDSLWRLIAPYGLRPITQLRSSGIRIRSRRRRSSPYSMTSPSGASSSSARKRTNASARRSTDALVRGYDATLVSDAHTTEDLSTWAPAAGARHRAHESVLGQP